MKKKGVLLLALACAIALPLIVVIARADDATHTTTLSSGPYDFGAGPESALIATVNSTSAADWSWHIIWFVTPTGGSEALYATGSTSRADGETSGFISAVATSGLTTGDSVRAHYETRDQVGTVLFSFDRYTVVP